MKQSTPNQTCTGQATTAGVFPVNASLIFQDADSDFLKRSLATLPKCEQSLVLSDDEKFLSFLPEQRRLDFTAAGYDEIPIRFDVVCDRLKKASATLGPDARILVDMRWGLHSVSASANFERWGGICDRLVDETGRTVISVYGRSLLIENQIMAALRGHSHFLAPSGTYTNPYWLPPEYVSGATLTQQVSFLLERLVPDYADTDAVNQLGDGEASGADPHWITTPARIRPISGDDVVWKIRCFGRLRIYLSDGSQIHWAIPGSAPKKSKALFAFLLQRGERGARADQLAELLWANEPDETVKRTRLHHTITMLRKTLGGSRYIVRTSDSYNLLPPVGTWIDVSSFEQLCHRAKVLANVGQSDDALTLLDAADRLYTGELFEDLLPDYVENEMEDWVIPRRIWFKEMMLKVQHDKAEILRHKDRLSEALVCCQKALTIDPSSELAHAETMRIFHAQNRPDAVTRQYRQYRAALNEIGAMPDTDRVENLHKSLIKIK